MPTPVAPISLGDISLEFAGGIVSNRPISAFYRGGANVPTGQTTSATDGTPISTSGLIRFGMFRGLTKTVTSSASYGGTMQSSAFGATAATATVTFQTNGTITGTLVGNLGGSNGATGDYYYTPTTTGIGSSYWMRYTLSSGQAPNIGSLVAGTWYQLSSARQIGYNSGTGGAFSSRNGTVLVEMALSSGGAVIASGSYSFSVDRES